MKTAIAANLARLRASKGWSQEEAATQAGLSRVGYANLETGKSQPQPDNLYALARAFGVRVEHLLTKPAQLAHVRFRSTKTLKLREEIIVRTAQWLEAYRAIEDIVGDRMPSKFPPPGSFPAGADGARAAAKAAREALDITPDEPIRNLGTLLEARGIKLWLANYASDTFFGLSVNEAAHGPAIVVNAWERISVERWIFSAAHELGHLLLHLSAYDVHQKDEDPAQEPDADVFAAYFLMPDTRFKREWDLTRGMHLVDRVFHVKRLFRVSYLTVLRRLQDLGHNEIWRRFFSLYSIRTKKSLSRKSEPYPASPDCFVASFVAEEPVHLTQSDLMATRLPTLVRTALDKNLISMSRAAEVLGLNLLQMRELVAAWAD